jgi:hypothetical protein
MGLNNTNVLSHSFGGWKSKIKVLAGLDLLWTSLLGFWVAISPMSLHISDTFVAKFLLSISIPVTLG